MPLLPITSTSASHSSARRTSTSAGSPSSIRVRQDRPFARASSSARERISRVRAAGFHAHCISTDSPPPDFWPPCEALISTSSASKLRAISAATLTASAAVAEPSVPTATVEIMARAYLPDRLLVNPSRLLLKAGCFEGFRRFMKPGIAHDPAVAEGPQGRFMGHHGDFAAMKAGAIAQHNRDVISHRPQLFDFDLPSLPPFEDSFDRSAESGAATSSPRLHGADGIDVLDFRVTEFDGSRELVASPRPIEAPHDLHVLLRHRLLLEPGGFEGFLPLGVLIHTRDLPLAQRIELV